MFFFPFRISVRKARRRSTPDQPDRASGHNQGNPQPATAPLLEGYPPATSYGNIGNIQEWADNVQPGANNNGSEGPSQGNGDGNGSGNAGSQQALLNPDGGNQQGNEDSHEEAQQGNSSGNEAPNNDNGENEADKYRFGKRDAIRAFLLARLENFLIRAQTVRDKLTRPRRPIPDGGTVPANELPPVPIPGGMSAAVPPAPILVKHM